MIRKRGDAALPSARSEHAAWWREALGVELRELLGGALLCLALAACSLEPDYPVPEVALPATYRNDATPLPDMKLPPGGARQAVSEPPALARPPSDWWCTFGSERLNRFVTDALAANHDLKAAMARVEQAQAQVGIARGALLPTIQLVGARQTSFPFGGAAGVTAGERNESTQHLYQLGASASYELDFWGKNRSAFNAAEAAARASLYDRDTVALTLVAQLVQAYVQYLAACERIAVAQQNIDKVNAILAVVQNRRRLGQGTDIEVEQQATAVALANAALPPLAIAREQARDQLAILVALPPESLQIDCAALDSLAIPAAPTSLPSQLLAVRPDIRKAEADLVGANANIGVARAQLLPSFDLVGERGVASAATATLFSPASFYYLLAANMTQTLFDYGKSLSQIDLSKAVYAEKAETYRQAILTALRDVEDAMALTRLTADEETANAVASARADRAYDLVLRAFRTGTVTYLTILDIERTQYQAADARVQARRDRLTAAVQFFQALGGNAVPETAGKP
ncbi:MAG: efflux transporter outer membrane subunit [Alphaproteobacteria bacterium]|nr:efflux transporter outer membrane subunit [Alphaproteobacteria bacterium]